MAGIANPKIQAALDAYVAKQPQKVDVARTAAMVSDVNDYATALASVKLDFGLLGLAVKGGAVYFGGKPINTGVELQASLAVLTADDLAQLLVALTAVLV